MELIQWCKTEVITSSSDRNFWNLMSKPGVSFHTRDKFSSLTAHSHKYDRNVRNVPVLSHLCIVTRKHAETQLIFQTEHKDDCIHPLRKLEGKNITQYEEHGFSLVTGIRWKTIILLILTTFWNMGVEGLIQQILTCVIQCSLIKHKIQLHV